MPYIKEDELERRLEIAKQRGATPQQIQQKRQQYLGSVKRKDPFLVGAVKSIAKPGVNAARDLVGSGITAASGIGEIAQRSTVDKQNKSRFFEKGMEAGRKLMTPQYSKAIYGEGRGGPVNASQFDIARIGAQRGVGAASYFVPGGTTATSAVGLGALEGAYRGFSEDANSIEDIIGNTGAGAIGGGIGGGASYGVGKALKGISNRGRNAAPLDQPIDVTGKKLDDDIFFGKNKAYSQDIANEAKLQKTQSAEEQLSTLLKFSEKQGAARTAQVKGKTFDINKILSDFENGITNNTEFQDATPADRRSLNLLLEKLNKTGGDGEALDSLRAQLSKEIYGSGGSATRKSVKKQLLDAIKEEFGRKIDGVNVLNMKQYQAGQLAEEIANRARLDNPLRAEVPLINPGGFRTGVGVDLPVTRGQAATFFPRARQAMNTKITEGARLASPVVRPLGTALESRGGQMVGSQLGSSYATGGNRQDFVAPISSQGDSQRTLNQQGPINPTQATLLRRQGVDISNRWVIHPNGKQIWNPNIKDWMEYDAKAFGAAGEEGDKGSANAESGLRAVKTVGDLIYKDGGINRVDLGRSLLPFGGGSADAQILATAKKEMQDVLQRARTGAAINPSEYEFYRSQLPAITDAPETIEYKLKLFESLFRRLGGAQ